ncbi:MAG TPA: UTP--glucose-1-phosphate uridylyltransferase GalU [Polyangia bacterium]|jgi:UTP--glucose-1-phosphate uridylyltransferase|nr:UTP--glucose-1-phosphate uridylyltransferase GalU [Polyangia bacterium]
MSEVKRAKVRKAVLPVAGLGTRFLPVTKAIPKEMLPIVDVPSIQLIVEECVGAGIEEIILVTARGKSALEDHFDRAGELEALLEKRGKTADLALARKPAQLARVIAVRQAEARGLGHAVLCAREAVGDEPFAVVLGDDLLDARVPGVRQVVDVYERWGTGVVGLKEVPAGHEHMYGIIEGKNVGGREWKVSRMVEKPAPGTAPSRLAAIGRYVLPAEIFEILAQTAPGRGGEIQLTDGLATLCGRSGLHGVEMAGQRFDAGDRAGYVLAQLHWALKRGEIADEVRAGAKRILEATPDPESGA